MFRSLLRFGNSSTIQKIERTNFFSFFTKVLLMIVPAILLGHYNDEFIRKLQDRQQLGSDVWKYVLLQTLTSVAIVYIIYRLFHSYADEFQSTSAGLFFTALFWSVQTAYIANLKKIL